MSYGIPSIGMNPLGTLGLGGIGSYSSFSDPMTMGMMGGYSPYAMGGMMGMYNPTFMAQMNQMQQNMEKSQLQHTADMHELLLKNNVENFTAQDRAIFEKAMVDAGVNKGISNLAAKIREGDQDGICQEFDALKQTLYTKYNDYFKANSGKLNPADSVTNLIEILYGQIISRQQNEIVDLKSDIKKYGETAFEHGFWKNLHGKDYHDKYSEETLSYLYGTSVDNKAGKERMSKLGAYMESGVEAIASPFVGAAAGVGALGIGAGLGKLLTFGNLPIGKTFSKCGKFAACAGAIAAFAGDIMWQMSR